MTNHEASFLNEYQETIIRSHFLRSRELGEAVIKWLNDTDESYFFKKNSKNDLINELLKPVSRLDQESLNQLQALAVPNDQDASPLLQHRRQLLRTFFNQSEVAGFVTQIGGVVILNGSLVYDDIRNGDADVSLLLRGSEADINRREARQHSLAFDNYWLEQTQVDTHGITYIHVADFDTPEKVVARMTEDYELFYYEANSLNRIITALPVLPEQQAEFDQIRGETLAVIEDNRLLTALANLMIRMCLQARLERRGLG